MYFRYNYEIVTGLDSKDKNIRVAALLTVMEKECHMLQQQLDIPSADREDSLQKHFEPTQNVKGVCFLLKYGQGLTETTDYVVTL